MVLLLKHLELLYLTNCGNVSGGKQLEGAFSFSPAPDFEIVVKKSMIVKRIRLCLLSSFVSSVSLLSAIKLNTFVTLCVCVHT